jgi:PAS domain S-box-containing protein
MKRGQRTNFDLFSFFEKSPDLVCLVSKEGEFLNVNPTVLKKLGYTREELFANPVLSYIHPEDLELTSSLRSELLKGKTLHNFQNRYITKKGNTIWLEWTSLYYPDQEVVLAIAKDITSRKKMEEEIEAKFEKFRSLASHFKTNLEQSRKFLAIELHEELAQLAFVARLDI